jgi:F0F1-type ATP synthase membrane subunit c/vacuolar-type H+-ATPase subunit K
MVESGEGVDVSMSSEQIAQSMRITNIIAVALAASVPVYAGLAWVLAPTLVESEGVAVDIKVIAVVLGVVSVGQLVLAQTLFASRLRVAEQMTTPELRLGGHRMAVIIAFALREGVAICGLALSFLSGDPRWALGFGAVSLASMLLGWPKRAVMERLASEVPPIG